MEFLYLLGSVASSTLTSTVLSITLFAHAFFSSLLSCFHHNVADDDHSPSLWLYEGEVRHVRRRPVHHAFDYPVRYALVDLDRFADASGRHKPFPLAAHLSAAEARRITGTDGSILLLTIPASVGYEQNPLSVYYCFDQGDSSGSPTLLKKCIAEVTNTPWGERVTFVFKPGSDLVAKPLHVSPFMDMSGSWSIHANAPGDNLFLKISVQHPMLGNYFTASLKAKRVSSSVEPNLYFWLMPQRVALWIYFQALKLWGRNVSFVQHPRYGNPAYRNDAVMSDRELCCSLENELNTHTERYCVWRDAQWPWA